MGGRGALSRIIKKLPNYKNAEIARDKLKNYILNPNKSKGKSRFFNAIGYNMSNYRRLESDIRKGLKNNPAVQYKPNRYGHTAYSVNMELGIGKKSEVVTAWQIDYGGKKPRFITARKSKKKE